MPVTTRIITVARGSRRNEKLTLKSPDAIQLYPSLTIALSGAAITRAAATRETMNAAIIAPQATAPAVRLLTRRPRLAFTRKPTNGSRGISSSMRRAQPGNAKTAKTAQTDHSLRGLRPLPPLTFSPFERREHVGVQRLALAEQRDHNRQANRRFGGGDRHHEEHDDLAVHRSQLAPEGDEAQVHGVQHDLDRQQNRDDIASDEDAGRADRTQHRREDQVVVERWHQRGSLRASTTAPTMATRMSSEVTSNANAYSVKSDRPMASTELVDRPGNALSPPAPSPRPSSAIRTSASTTPNPTGPRRISGCTRKSCSVSSCGALSSMTTKRNSTMIAPA